MGVFIELLMPDTSSSSFLSKCYLIIMLCLLHQLDGLFPSFNSSEFLI
jgi:hypothetical protein